MYTVNYVFDVVPLRDGTHRCVLVVRCAPVGEIPRIPSTDKHALQKTTRYRKHSLMSLYVFGIIDFV